MTTDGIARDGLKTGDIAIVTGGGGGFGRAFCLRLSTMGARIAIWDIDEKEGAETLRQVTEKGGDATFFHVDLSDAASIASASQKTLDTMGVPYCIINNASVFPRGEVIELSLAQWELTLKVNITAPFLIAKTFGPLMIEQRRGVVINLASGRAIEGAAKGANYACTKAAMLSLTKSLALEWARHGIRVNAIIPGQSLTAMPLVATTEADMHAQALTRNPMGRIGYPEDVAGLAAYLVSEDAAYMTGQGIAINGGAVMIP
jgi:NAD(P)-dependent dehydrogenase (short-subunit alcohol dehydrogenase family)